MSKKFQSANLIWWTIIPGSIILLFLLSYTPNIVPYRSLGVFGSILSYLTLNYRIFLMIVLWSTIIAHGYEAILARRICQQLNIDQQSTFYWIIQTFIIGFPSLTILKGYIRQV